MWIYMAQTVPLNPWWHELWGLGLEPEVFPSSSVPGTDTENVNSLCQRAAQVSLRALQPDSAEFSTDPADFSSLAYHIFLRLLEEHFRSYSSQVCYWHTLHQVVKARPFFIFHYSLGKKWKQAILKCTSSYVPQITPRVKHLFHLFLLVSFSDAYFHLSFFFTWANTGETHCFSHGGQVLNGLLMGFHDNPLKSFPKGGETHDVQS